MNLDLDRISIEMKRKKRGETQDGTGHRGMVIVIENTGPCPCPWLGETRLLSDMSDSCCLLPDACYLLHVQAASCELRAASRELRAEGEETVCN
jgi:hypothetical protein